MNVVDFVQFFGNLSLCDKARVAFNQQQVKGMAGSPNERMTSVRRRDRRAPFFLCLHSFTKDIQQSKRERERGIFRGSGLASGREREEVYASHSFQSFLPRGPHNHEATCMMKRAINTCPRWEAK